MHCPGLVQELVDAKVDLILRSVIHRPFWLS